MVIIDAHYWFHDEEHRTMIGRGNHATLSPYFYPPPPHSLPLSLQNPFDVLGSPPPHSIHIPLKLVQ